VALGGPERALNFTSGVWVWLGHIALGFPSPSLGLQTLSGESETGMETREERLGEAGFYFFPDPESSMNG
jgi:hypothetical protein